jgi:hypothetical protein
MATASVTNNFTNGTPADAEQVDANFADLVTFLNNSVVHRDGSKAMTAALDAGNFKLTNVAAATVASDAPRFDQTGVVEYEATSGAVTLPEATLTTVDTVTITSPTAGVAWVLFLYQLNTSGVTFGGGDISTTLSVSSTWGAGIPMGGSTSTSVSTNTTTQVLGVAWLVGLSAGANTVTISATGTRLFGATGGTLTVVSGARSSVIGAF